MCVSFRTGEQEHFLKILLACYIQWLPEVFISEITSEITEITEIRVAKNVSPKSFEISGIVLTGYMESQSQVSHSSFPCFIVSHSSQIPTTSPMLYSVSNKLFP